ncbi:putative amidohydrolase YtcJ [Thermocatellispora tengchongensis]|uniref:Putative amidohydrolase YtcJ n=1 Tax=Thermocatellispora tengchongensis TaxID=1073253 RepID=A0A840PH16_9ACTN|nr:amidohydrolase family protein [Thermocatellispora tengchongensis]MBB5136810.1 putative amidohydrolase YtcJ [Thermocatellispora tengchongensis]
MASNAVSRRQLMRVAAVGAMGAAALRTGPAHAARDAGSGRGGAADLVLYGGRILTMAGGAGVARAIAIKDGVVVQVGDDASVRRLIGRRTEVVALRGRTVLPGINDAHLHGLRTGLALPPYNVDVGESAVGSIADVARQIAAAVAQAGAGAWIRGKGWNETAFAEGRPPTRHDLDPVSPGHPVALLNVDPRWFVVTGVKLRADGVPIASRTAWMREPYAGGGRGGLVTIGSTDEEKAAELTAMIALVHRAGLQIGTHATGDAAIDAVAAAYAEAIRSRRHGDPRHYVIHGDFAWPETLRSLARHGCGVSLNPNIKHLIADTQTGVVGDARAAYQTPYRSALRARVMVTSASDSPNVAPDWRQGLETALLREGRSGAVSGPDERIGLDEALRTYTTSAAWQDHAERWKGSLRRGMAGDLCVLDGHLTDERGRLAMDAHEISDLPVALTVVDGAIAYDASDPSARAAAAEGRAVSWASRPNPAHMCASC